VNSCFLPISSLQSAISNPQKILAFSDNLRYNYSIYRFLVAQASACNGLIVKHFLTKGGKMKVFWNIFGFYLDKPADLW
jgi:hypothetical protein